MKQNNRKAAALLLSQNGFRLKGVDHSRSYPVSAPLPAEARRQGTVGIRFYPIYDDIFTPKFQATT